MKRPDDYAPANPAAAEGVEYKRTFGGEWPMKRGRANKYGAVRTELDGITFASKAEARKYAELRMLERAGKIGGLELQPRFAITIKGQKIATYVADFAFFEHGPDGYAKQRIVLDVKGMKTPVYRLKKKAVEAQYGITIRETWP